MNKVILESDECFEENNQGNVTKNDRQGDEATLDEIVEESPTEEVTFRPTLE